jgi:hypothetical protein
MKRVILAPAQHTVFFVQLSVELITEFPVVMQHIGPPLLEPIRSYVNPIHIFKARFS